MVNGFCQGTIGVNGFSMFFLQVNHRWWWFFTSQPLVSMVFPMVFYRGTIGIDGFFRWTIGINGLSNGYINWSTYLLISWKSYRYHQYPKYIPSYLEPSLALVGDGQAWTPNIFLKSFDMDSVQVGKAAFVKESYTTLGIEPRTFITFTDNFREPGANLRHFMMLIVRLLAIPTQDLLAL